MLTSDIKMKGSSLFFLFIASLLLAGCQSTASFYNGYLADNQSIAPVTENWQSHWETFDINLEYRATKTGTMLNINGDVNFSLYHQLNSGKITRFDLYLYFLNGQNEVMQAVALLQRNFLMPEERLQVDRNLKIPGGAESIAFGYDGIAREEDLSGDISPFYDLPKRPE